MKAVNSWKKLEIYLIGKVLWKHLLTQYIVWME